MDDTSLVKAEYARLLGEIRSGNRTAEGELLAQLQGPLRVVLRNMSGSAQLAEDLCQDVLIVVLAAAREGAVLAPEALVEYALGTARRLFLNERRKQVRQRTESNEQLVDETGSARPEAAELVEAQELRRRIATVLAELNSDRDRQVLYAYYLQERNSAELQAAHHLDSLQLARILHRSRKRFASLWKKRYRNEGELT